MTDVRQRGLALIAVLWIVAALSVMVAMALAQVRTDIQLTHTQVRLAKARALGEAGIYWAIHALLAPRQTVRPGLPEGPLRLAWGGAEVRVAISNEAGKIDVNTADRRLIEHALQTAGVESDSMNLLQSHRRGGEQKRFTSVEAFVSALGIFGESARRVIPSLTAHNGQHGINPLLADRAVLLAVPGLGEGEVDRYLERRVEEPFHYPDFASGSQYFTRRLSSVYYVTAHSTVGGVSSTTGSLVRLSAVAERPYEILKWHASLAFGGKG